MKLITIGFIFLLSILSPVPGQTEELTRSQVETIIREFLIKNPEVLMEAIGVLKERAEQETLENNRKAIFNNNEILFNDPLSVVMGNPNGDVTLVEFYDYRCPFCRKMHLQIESLIASDPKLRVVMKQYPVRDEPNEPPVSLIAAQLALAADKQGKFSALHNAFFAAEPPLTETQLYNLASSAGLDLVKLKKDSQSPEVLKQVRETVLLADRLGVNGTPTFVIGDIIIPGAVETTILKQLISRVRSQKVRNENASQNP